MRSVFGPTLEELGPQGSKTETTNRRNARAALVALLGNVGEDQHAIEIARRTVTEYMRRSDRWTRRWWTQVSQ